MYDEDIQVGVVWEDDTGTTHRDELQVNAGCLPEEQFHTLPEPVQTALLALLEE